MRFYEDRTYFFFAWMASNEWQVLRWMWMLVKVLQNVFIIIDGLIEIYLSVYLLQYPERFESRCNIGTAHNSFKRFVN